MSAWAYYNENDPYAAAWLRNLIIAELIAPGEVDERSIRDVHPVDLMGFTQAHFFAGIGVWSYALRRAGWPDDLPVWTGSCPCQPFSAAGKRGGFDDERHLWPVWFPLIRAHRPAVVFGEQVASKVGLSWLDLVHADLEGANYAVRAADTCAAGFGAPHIRQRLYFVADDNTAGRSVERSAGLLDGEREAPGHHVDRCGAARKLAGRGELERDCVLGDADDTGSQGRRLLCAIGGRDSANQRAPREAGPVNGFWHPADWLPCRDGKARPVEPGTFPLAHGAPARVGRLRAYGNAINAEVAKEFIVAAKNSL